MHTYKSQEYPLVGLHLHKSKRVRQRGGKETEESEELSKEGQREKLRERERERPVAEEVFCHCWDRSVAS